ncbi:beta strand repeat-containing protein [Allokutzneria oryzae]|uniref:Beta strand repeat-containing protein n=1 Tax=Allokutzneria oryzae TaxID=1378989 RepID=A0ABV6A003_9PSEU
MNTWAKRGIRAAIVTGGMFMLGAGIAQAHEADSNPDRPINTVDGTITVKVNVDGNAIGAPLGLTQVDLPSVKRDISVNPTAIVEGLVGQEGAKVLRGNKVQPQVVVPVNVTGNAIAVLGGKAEVENTSSTTVSNGGGVTADGSETPVGGNVVAPQVALPVDISGNAIAAVAGRAESHSTSEVEATTGGDITTSGEEGPLAGNVVSPQAALPVQVTGNAIAAVLSGAETNSESKIGATSGGDITTTGEDGAAAGNIVGPAVALPVELNGNALGAIASLPDSNSATQVCAEAGGDRTSTGEDAIVAGNVVAPYLAGPVVASGNGGGVLVNADADNASETWADATGAVRTNGEEGVLNGNLVSPAGALPVELAGNAVGAVSNVDAADAQVIDSKAGGDRITNGDNGLISGTNAAPNVTGPVGGFGNVAGVLINGDAQEDNTVDAGAGGYTGSRGFGALVGGNVLQPSVASLPQVFGGAGGVLSNVETHVTNDRTSHSGGGTNADDDAGVASGNAVAPTVAGPFDVFAVSGGVLSHTDSTVENASDVAAGGEVKAFGKDGVLAGNVVHPAIARPTQVFGIAGGIGTHADAVASNEVASVSGGDTITGGDEGALTGNTVVPSLSGATQLFGLAGGVASNADTVASNLTDTKAGGDHTTTGADGAVAGNIVDPSLAPPVQVFGNAAGVASKLDAEAANAITSLSGGTNSTDGSNGAVAGNVAWVPLAGAVQAFGNAPGVASNNSAAATNDVISETGALTSTDGTGGALAGNVVNPALGPVVQGFGNAVAVAAVNDALGSNVTSVNAGGDSETAGDNGAVAGNVVHLPLGPVGQVFGNAVGAPAGNATGVADSTLDSVVGGSTTTSGHGLSGVDAVVPVGAGVQIFDIPVRVLGQALTSADHTTSVVVGEEAAQALLPVTDPGLLAATELPSLPFGAQPRAATGALPLPAELVQLPKLPTLPKLPVGGQAPALGMIDMLSMFKG